MISCIMLVLPQFGGGLTSDEMNAVFYDNFESDFKDNKKILFPKYNNLYTLEEYNNDKEQIKNNYFIFTKQISELIINNYKIKGLEKKTLLLKQKEISKDFVNKYF